MQRAIEAASFSTGIASALLALGVIGPLAYHIFRHELMAADLAVTCAIASVVVHVIARWLLGALEVE